MKKHLAIFFSAFLISTLLPLASSANPKSESEKTRRGAGVTCPSCPKTYGDDRALSVHFQGVHANMVRACPHCQKIFPGGNNYARHIRKVHSDKVGSLFKARPLLRRMTSSEISERRKVALKARRKIKVEFTECQTPLSEPLSPNFLGMLSHFEDLATQYDQAQLSQSDEEENPATHG